MATSIGYLERRADRLLAEWGAIEDLYSLPQREFQKAERKIHEASIICLCLEVIKEKCKKCKNNQAAENDSGKTS